MAASLLAQATEIYILLKEANILQHVLQHVLIVLLRINS